MERGPAPEPPLFRAFLKAQTVKPKVFVSYHHGADRWAYDDFKRRFDDVYDICEDNSVHRKIDSDNPDYVIRTIRENHLTGTSCTIVLCGAETPWRKFVDWEIKASLDKQHALIGVNLPTNPRDVFGYVRVPNRLYDNLRSGFAVWIEWNQLLAGGTAALREALAKSRLSPRAAIANSRKLRGRNG